MPLLYTGSGKNERRHCPENTCLSRWHGVVGKHQGQAVGRTKAIKQTRRIGKNAFVCIAQITSWYRYHAAAWGSKAHLSPDVPHQYLPVRPTGDRAAAAHAHACASHGAPMPAEGGRQIEHPRRLRYPQILVMGIDIGRIGRTRQDESGGGGEGRGVALGWVELGWARFRHAGTRAADHNSTGRRGGGGGWSNPNR